ncbi:hypothetical protein HDU67_000942 [Dinochytrium kinnereticum]|nr:hypothetical protein HDU67_000942 [Dinochytrium kinnereticum]
MKPRVFLCRPLPPTAQKALITDSRVTVESWDSNDAIPRSILLEKISGADGVLVMLTDRVDAEFMNAAGPQLKVVSTMSVGYDHIDVVACRKSHPDIRFGITPDVLTDCTAELTVGLLLATAHRFKEATRAVTDGTWGKWSPTWMCGSQMTSKTIGLVGFGRIGCAVAERLAPFKPARLLYSSPSAKSAADAVNAQHVAFDELLRNSDIVIVTCKLTPETRHMFAKSAFGKMKPNSIFINTARGGIVNQDDLFDALRDGVIGAAGLDVTDPEPMSPTHPLTTLHNCIILPHIGSATIETREAMAMLAVNNVIAGVLNEPLLAHV